MELKKISLITTVFYLIAFFAIYTREKAELYINFIDVGQGDAIFIRTAEGSTLLIDGGDNSEADRALNQEMFFPLCRLDHIILTHPHADHYKGLEKILKRCSVGELTFNDISSGSGALDSFRQIITDKFVKNNFLGDEISFGKGNIKILWPPRELMNSGIKNLNDVSIVVFLDYGNFEGLFLGDLQDNYQDDLDLSSIKSQIQGKLDVLKVAHHGSHNGVYIPLISELKPEKCIVSVGSDNKFGHPDAGSMRELTESGCEVLRTDLIGDIVIKIN